MTAPPCFLCRILYNREAPGCVHVLVGQAMGLASFRDKISFHTMPEFWPSPTRST